MISTSSIHENDGVPGSHEPTRENSSLFDLPCLAQGLILARLLQCGYGLYKMHRRLRSLNSQVFLSVTKGCRLRSRAAQLLFAY